MEWESPWPGDCWSLRQMWWTDSSQYVSLHPWGALPWGPACLRCFCIHHTPGCWKRFSQILYMAPCHHLLSQAVSSLLSPRAGHWNAGQSPDTWKVQTREKSRLEAPSSTTLFTTCRKTDGKKIFTDNDYCPHFIKPTILTTEHEQTFGISNREKNLSLGPPLLPGWLETEKVSDITEHQFLPL